MFPPPDLTCLQCIPRSKQEKMSTFGTLFRVTTYGESHCASVGAIVDGCPPVRDRQPRVCFRSLIFLYLIEGIAAGGPGCPDPAEQKASRPKQSHHAGKPTYGVLKPCSQAKSDACQRDEKDLVQLQSGLEHGITLGTPIGLLVKNEDQRPRDYSEVRTIIIEKIVEQTLMCELAI